MLAWMYWLALAVSRQQEGLLPWVYWLAMV